MEHGQSINRISLWAHPIVGNHRRKSASHGNKALAPAAIFEFEVSTAIIAAGRKIDTCSHVGLSSSVVEQRTCNAQVVSSILTGGS